MLYPVLQDPLRPIVSSLFDRPRGASIGQMLFGAGEQGGWYDVSDMSTLFQDAAGATPVTAVEQQVGRILDKSGRGNHATQATTTKRPVLSRRVNLLLNSEFGGAVAGAPGTPPTGWGNGAVTGAISESATGIRLVADSTRRTISNAFSIMPNGVIVAKVKGVVNTSGALVQVFNIVGNVNPAVIASASYKVNGVAVASNYVMPVGAFDIECTLTASASGGSSYLVVGMGVHAAATGDVTFLTASLTLATDAHLPYQRVNTATDYDTDPAKFPAYLRFDGVDDALQTGNIDFTGTDKMTVWAGVTALDMGRTSGAINQLLSSNGAAFNGFGLRTPYIPGSISFLGSGSTAFAEPLETGLGAAPRSMVICGVGDQSAPLSQLRRDGVLRASNTAVQGASGGYGNRPMCLGSHAGISDFFNGRLYSLIVRGAQSTLSQIEATEAYIKQKMRLP